MAEASAPPSATPDPPQYPMHEKVMAVQAERRLLSRFLDFLSAQGIKLCVADDNLGYRWSGQSSEKLIAGFFGIDLAVFDAEKAAMYNQAAEQDGEPVRLLAPHPEMGQPFVSEHGPMPGYVVGACAHRVARSEYEAGWRTCERCDGGDYDLPPRTPPAQTDGGA